MKNKEGFEVQSAGTWKQARRRVSEGLIDWADMIFVMEEHHKEAIIAIRPEAKGKIEVLDVSDVFLRNDPDLLDILRTKLAEYLGTAF